MIAGWRQWADGGGTSSAFVEYLINLLGAKKIGHIKPDSLYLFQTPVSQFLFRPRIKFEEGYRTQMEGPRNDVYYYSNGKQGLVLFIGDEPHMNAERYAEAFFDIVTELKVKRVIATGGVYAVVPYDKDRSVTCTYSLPELKAELAAYAVNLSGYEGPVSIGSYLNDRAEALKVEYIAWYAFVPMYDFSRMIQSQQAQGISIEEDFKAWLDLLRRINHMFGMNIPTVDLAEKSLALKAQLDENVEEIAKHAPQFPVREYLAKVAAEFEEQRFDDGAPEDQLSDVWEDALGDIFKDKDDGEKA